MPKAPYSLTENQLYRLHRANSSIQVMANMLEDTGCAPSTYRKIGTVLELASDELESVMRDVEQTYAERTGAL